MEEQPKVDLKQYIPKKGNRAYIVKTLIYVSVLLFLIYLVTQKVKTQKDSKSIRDIEEIRGVEIINF